MHKAGLTIHQQRICQPYGDDQRRGLWLFHLIEPITWAKVVARVNGANSGALYIMFKDETSKDTTYPAGRYLVTEIPEGDEFVIDFNKAYSPPCAFTDFATCTLPPPQNTLDAVIKAGEIYKLMGAVNL